MMKRCHGYTKNGTICTRKTADKYCYQHLKNSGKPESNNFVMFSGEKRKEIMKNYNEIIEGNKKCTDYPLDKVIKAASGMYIYPDSIVRKKKIEALCDSINESNKNKQDPIVHDDSLTAWGNAAAELYGLEVGDILKMKPGETMDVILMDRNSGEYIGRDAKKGDKYNPRNTGFSYGKYTHKNGLKGILNIADAAILDPFEWEINLHGIGKDMFWGPIPKGYKYNEINPKIKVGWRGPAIKLEDAKNLPDHFVYYDTWWDDYVPYRTHNFLTK
jgi:hypothetical protein